MRANYTNMQLIMSPSFLIIVIYWKKDSKNINSKWVNLDLCFIYLFFFFWKKEAEVDLLSGAMKGNFYKCIG